MADKKISELAAPATALTYAERIPAYKSGEADTVYLTPSQIRSGLADLGAVSNRFTGKQQFDDAIAIDGTTGNGILVVGSGTNQSYGWRDITADITVRGVGSADPAWNVFRNGIRAYQFAVNDECWQVFHMPHDWVPGTDIHIHAHWAHASATVASGSVTWGFEATWARGFDQAAFGATVTASAQQTASTVQYRHMVAEAQLTAASPNANQIDTDLLETDGLFLIRTYLSANSMNGTPEPFLFTVDLHYQSTNMGTYAKVPGFYFT